MEIYYRRVFRWKEIVDDTQALGMWRKFHEKCNVIIAATATSIYFLSSVHGMKDGNNALSATNGR